MSDGTQARNGHLAIFHTHLDIGGISRTLVNLMVELDDRGYDIDLLLTSAEGEFLSQVPDGVNTMEIDRSTAPGIGIFASIPSVVRYLRDARPDTLLAAKPHSNLVAITARQLARVPTRVVVNRNSMTSHQLEYLDNRKHVLTVQLSKYLYPYADAIVAASQGVEDDVSETLGVSKELFSVVHNPIVTPEMLEKSKEPADHPWFDDDAPPVVLSAGRLHPQKNYASLVRAFARVRAEEDARLVILGKGQTMPKLRSLVEELGLEEDVALPGSTSNPYPYMRQASVLAVSSLTEALPSTLIEAMACGCPVVSTRCSSGPVEILRDGEFGELVPVNDPDALAAAIVATLRDPPSSSKLRERAMDFSAERITDQYERVLFPDRERRAERAKPVSRPVTDE